jgi:hypothetical protein
MILVRRLLVAPGEHEAFGHVDLVNRGILDFEAIRIITKARLIAQQCESACGEPAVWTAAMSHSPR